MSATDTSPSRDEPDRMGTLPATPLDQLAVRQVIADVDRVTTGRRRIDIANALLQIVGQEIAATAATPAAAKYHGILVAKQLKAFVRDAYDRRRRGAPAP